MFLCIVEFASVVSLLVYFVLLPIVIDVMIYFVLCWTSPGEFSVKILFFKSISNILSYVLFLSYGLITSNLNNYNMRLFLNYRYMTVGCTTLKLILRHFGPVIRSNIQSPVGSFGVDIPREERYQKSVKCHEMLSQLRSCIVKKLSLPGNVGATFREVQTMMVTTLD